MRCKNDPAASFSGTEPSPKGLGYCAHAERPGKVRKGLDGRTWVAVADKSGRVSWRVRAPVRPDADRKGDSARERCIRDFALYSKRTGKYSHQIVFGQSVDKGDGKRWLRTESGGDEPVLVPEGFRRKPVTRKRIEEIYCKPTVDRDRLAASGALEFSAWYDATRPYWLTISDLARMEQGDRMLVLSMHRNVGDVTADEIANPRGVPINPARFFRWAKAAFVRSGGTGIGGTLRFGSISLGGHKDAGYVVDVAPDVEFKPGSWYPLTDGALPAKDPQSYFKRLLGKRVAWEQLPSATHVGWRGPMVRWSDLPKLPPVWYE